MNRELKLVYRDRFNLYSRTFQITYLAFLSATLFIQPGYDTVAEGQLFLLEVFFAALISTFAGFGKIAHHCQIAVFALAYAFLALARWLTFLAVLLMAMHVL